MDTENPSHTGMQKQVPVVARKLRLPLETLKPILKDIRTINTYVAISYRLDYHNTNVRRCQSVNVRKIRHIPIEVVKIVSFSELLT